MMGHLNSFSASGVGNLNKNFPKIQMPGGLPGGGGECLSFDLTDTLTSKYNNTFCQNTALSTTCSMHLRKCTIFRKL